MEKRLDDFYKVIEKDMLHLVEAHLILRDPTAMFATIGAMSSLYCDALGIDVEQFMADLLEATKAHKKEISEVLKEVDK